MKVALVHDWLNGMRGGERVLESLLEIWPDASLHTLFYDPGSVSPAIRNRRIRTSFLDRIPAVGRSYRYLLPLMPAAIRSLDLGHPDLVVSSSHAVAKGVSTGGALHICYCHTPMRYIWDAAPDYQPGPVERLGLGLVRRPLRAWDRRTAAGVDHFIANSRFVGGRIQSYYGRHATVIPPPVDTDRFRGTRRVEDYFLWVGALVGYKRPDLAVRVFTANRRRLIVAGSGPLEKRLRQHAGSNVEFRGWLSPDALRELYLGARGLVFPGREDAGIAPIEARVAGCPIIAFNGGGAVENLIDGRNAVLFSDQTVDSLTGALARFDGMRWDPETIREGTGQFSRERFRNQIERFVEDCRGPSGSRDAARRG